MLMKLYCRTPWELHERDWLPYDEITCLGLASAVGTMWGNWVLTFWNLLPLRGVIIELLETQLVIQNCWWWANTVCCIWSNVRNDTSHSLKMPPSEWSLVRTENWCEKEENSMCGGSRITFSGYLGPLYSLSSHKLPRLPLNNERGLHA
jgi:hypothetical protein